MKHFLTLFALLTTSLAFGQESCPNMHDSNSNGTIDIEDFLSVLGLFGDVDADADGLWDSQDGCTDLESCNFMDVSAEFCTYPDAIGDCNGDCTEDADGDGICDVHSCGTSLSYQGYDYATVLIGEQCWFADNLRSENYENGDEIPAGLGDSEWDNTSSGAVAVYGEGSSECYDNSPDGDACDETWSLSEYGRLYNWYAVDDGRGLCPNGWHVPTDGEWMVLTDHLGGESVAGGQIKASYGWHEGGNGTNSSGFSGLPGGYRYDSGYFYYAGYSGGWWSSSPYGSYAWVRGLSSGSEGVDRYNGIPQGGFSVRCVRDAE